MSSSARFLIADRDPHVREGCRRFLTARGFEADVAGNGRQCLERIRELCPTVLVLDPEILWGGGDGVLEWLCEQQPLSPMTVLLTDGHTRHSMPEHAQRLVAVRLERPLGIHDLEHFVDRIEQEAAQGCLECPDQPPLAVERVY
jgi:DNA-binding NtrC family response regulator